MKNDAKSYGLKDFIREMTEVVEIKHKEAERVADAENLLGKLIRTRLWLPQDILLPDNDQYARHSLYRDPEDRFEVLVLVWKPGQSTPLHDHDGTWGVEGVISGRMKVTNYLQIKTYPNNSIKLSRSGAMTLNEKSTGELLPPADCHILEAEGEETTITVHVYGKQLKKLRVFDHTEESGIYSIRELKVGFTTIS